MHAINLHANTLWFQYVSNIFGLCCLLYFLSCSGSPDQQQFAWRDTRDIENAFPQFRAVHSNLLLLTIPMIFCASASGRASISQLAAIVWRMAAPPISHWRQQFRQSGDIPRCFLQLPPEKMGACFDVRRRRRQSRSLISWRFRVLFFISSSARGVKLINECLSSKSRWGVCGVANDRFDLSDFICLFGRAIHTTPPGPGEKENMSGKRTPNA